jgi:histidinol-phosphate phosphatase family protein
MNIIFLDRDGTIIRDPEDERVTSEEKIELFPDTIEALTYLAKHNFSVVLITNQAGISEGRITAEDFDRINNKVIELLKPSGVKILKTYMCSHGPDDKCDCRKPSPKMILEALKESLRWIKYTFLANLVRKILSSIAESPPPTTAIVLSL